MAAPLVVAVVHLIVRLEILALQVKSGPPRDRPLWLRPQAALWMALRNSSRASAGVFQPRVLRGLVLRASATAARVSASCTLRSVPLGKYWRSSPLVFSFVPRCQGL